jgi:hypothetical protein
METIRKLTLRLDDVAVESFDTQADARDERGTVHAASGDWARTDLDCSRPALACLGTLKCY